MHKNYTFTVERYFLNPHLQRRVFRVWVRASQRPAYVFLGGLRVPEAEPLIVLAQEQGHVSISDYTVTEILS